MHEPDAQRAEAIREEIEGLRHMTVVIQSKHETALCTPSTVFRRGSGSGQQRTDATAAAGAVGADAGVGVEPAESLRPINHKKPRENTGRPHCPYRDGLC